ncbi:gluconate:H+ symporter [Mucilaginibacter arboris]|uniref:Gluconate transporter n=1 Tax=Mucilaginibacter arboris TaxID=2682090 RepID=A0A7K1SXK6_9SPHI|nr:gluconate:H+ symporter [Mucilaginibacter arboris]MVN22056.1 gluconate transporter [Mucilaginibacter arboris]
MTFFIISLLILALIVLIGWLKIHPFLAFLLVSVLAALLLGIPLNKVAASIEKGIGDMLGSIAIIITLGAMLGKLVADSGAAQKIAAVMMQVFGTRYIRLALMLTGLIIGMPLFYGVGFVLMVPLIFSIAYKYKLPAVYLGLPMLASLSVTHGFLPPHPSPTAMVFQFHADMGITLLYGIVIAIPAVVISGLFFSGFLKKISSQPLQAFVAVELPENQLPGTANSFLTALLPVILLMALTLLPLAFQLGPAVKNLFSFLAAPSIVLLIALIFATFSLGVFQKKNIGKLMDIYGDAIKDIASILLIIGGSGALKQVLTDSGASNDIAALLQGFNLQPLLLGWLIAAIIRVCIGSATVAGLTAAGIIMPLMVATHTNPNLMVLSIGAGSLMFSHVNDSGFWLYKEYFNLSIKNTLLSWSIMETLVAFIGLAGVLILNIFV